MLVSREDSAKQLSEVLYSLRDRYLSHLLETTRVSFAKCTYYIHWPSQLVHSLALASFYVKQITEIVK